MLQAVCSHSCGVCVLLAPVHFGSDLMIDVCVVGSFHIRALFYRYPPHNDFRLIPEGSCQSHRGPHWDVDPGYPWRPWVPPQKCHHFAQLKGRYIHVDVMFIAKYNRKMHLPDSVTLFILLRFPLQLYRYCNSCPSNYIELPHSHTLVAGGVPVLEPAGSTLSGRCAQSDWPRHCY